MENQNGLGPERLSWPKIYTHRTQISIHIVVCRLLYWHRKQFTSKSRKNKNKNKTTNINNKAKEKTRHTQQFKYKYRVAMLHNATMLMYSLVYLSRKKIVTLSPFWKPISTHTHGTVWHTCTHTQAHSIYRFFDVIFDGKRCVRVCFCWLIVWSLFLSLRVSVIMYVRSIRPQCISLLLLLLPF